jgi:hypothetical protein
LSRAAHPATTPAKAYSLVVLGCQGPRDPVKVTLRYDLDLQGRPAADSAEHAIAMLDGNDLRILVAVGYGPADAVGRHIDAIAAAAEAGIAVARALRVEGGRYFTYNQDGPAEGVPFITTPTRACSRAAPTSRRRSRRPSALMPRR